MTNDLTVQFPSKPPKRTRGMNIKVSTEELERYTTLANVLGVSLSEMVRALCEAQYNKTLGDKTDGK